MSSVTRSIAAFGVTLLACVSTAGCGSESKPEGSGSVTILLEPETTILDGLEPGDRVNQVRDGWRVEFAKYVLGIGHVRSHFGADHDVEVEAEGAFFVDLKALPSDGLALWELSDLAPGRWTFGYQFVVAGHGARRHGSVSKSDFERIESERLSHLVTGTLSKQGGVSCPPRALLVEPELDAQGKNAVGDDCYPNPTIRFEFSAVAEAEISNCEQDGLPGFAVANDRRSTVSITIHGDHLFFNGFPEGGEGGIARLAQLWADADLNVDGTITASEYATLLLADMSEWDDRYQKGGAPLERLETLGDLVEGQLKTQGHMDGEGECAVDGVSHDHD